MQREIGNFYYPGSNLNPLKDVSKVPTIDNIPTLNNAERKLNMLSKLWNKGQLEISLSRYIPGLTKPARQGQIAKIEDQITYADQTYEDKKTLEFSIRLASNCYTNFSTMELVLPIFFSEKDDKATAIPATVRPVNNFFTHWIKEIDIKRYPDQFKILPTNNIVPISDHAAKYLKHMPSEALNTIKYTLLYEKTRVSLKGDRRSHSSNTPADRTDDNIVKRTTDFTPASLLKKGYYRIPLKFFTELGNVNCQHNINTNFTFTLETNIMKLFENTAKADLNLEPDAAVNFHARPYITYNVIQLDSNFQQYFNNALIASSALRQGVFLNPYRQNFEIATGSQTQIVKFENMPTQIEWIEISLVPEKSYQHLTAYDSYDLEIAAKTIGNIKLNNVNSIYDSYTTHKYDLTDENDKMLLYKNFVAYVTDGCSTAPLPEYRNNDIYKELTKYKDYFGSKSDERLYIDLRRSRGYTGELEKLVRNDSGVSLTINLKEVAAYKLRLFVTVFAQAEWFYATGAQGQSMTLKPYTVVPKKTIA